MKKDSTFVAQRLLFPDPEVNSEPGLFFHQEGGGAGFNSDKKEYFALEKSILRFDTYFNSFPAYLFDFENRNSLRIRIAIKGDFVVKVMLARHGKSWENLYQSLVSDSKNGVFEIKIPAGIKLDGLIYVELIAVTKIFISSIDYCIEGEVACDASITGVITTYKRDEAVQATGRRLNDYFVDNTDISSLFKLLVIDNGGDTDSIPFEQAKVIKNKNLGGAGGFTRGLLEIVEQNLSTHALFMDDDASFFPESLRRTLAILRYNDDNLAISGAMIALNHRWRMWENGATFNQRCIPLDCGRDLNRFDEVMALSVGQSRNISNRYGAWWYFCFPVKDVKIWPFPFFVRGDDIYFSLSNKFNIVNIPGIAAHQEDFSIKQSPLTIYLDVRNHIVQHLTFDDLDIGAKKLKKLLKRFFDRYNNSYHYETAEAINQAIKDVLSGEKFWEENIDMSDRRKSINSIISSEKISDIVLDLTKFAKHSPRRNNGRISSFIRKLTLNGHLLPQKTLYKKGVIFPLELRAIEHDSFRRPYTITIDLSSGKGYVCERNIKKFFKNRLEFNKLVILIQKNYQALRNEYKLASKSITSRCSWENRFND